MPQPTRRLQQIKPYVFAALAERKREALARGATILDLSLGSPDQPTPAPIIEALAEAARDVTRHGYPSFTGEPAYKEAFAAYLQRRFGATIDPVTMLVPTAGAKEALAQLIQVYCDEHDVLLIPDVSYPVYQRAAMATGAETVLLPVRAEDGWWPDLEAIPAETRRRARVLILNFPNNPTGAVTTRERWAEAVAFANRHDILLVSDLAYSELAFAGEPACSVLEIPGAQETAVEIHSCSKIFSMAGLRVGMVVAPPAVAAALNACRNLVGYGAPTAIQRAAAFAFANAERFSAEIGAGYRARIAAAVDGFTRGGHRVSGPPGGMYLWLPVPAGLTDWELMEALMAREGIIVTPGSGFGPGGNGYVRLSMVASPAVLGEATERAAALWVGAGVAG